MTIQTTDLFNATFGVTASQSGLPDTATLLAAISLQGGGLKPLNRHAAAGLASADSGINNPFTVQEVIDLYRDAVGADPGPILTAGYFIMLLACGRAVGPEPTVERSTVAATRCASSAAPAPAAVGRLLPAP